MAKAARCSLPIPPNTAEAFVEAIEKVQRLKGTAEFVQLADGATDGMSRETLRALHAGANRMPTISL
jgi:hypothetical protein